MVERILVGHSNNFWSEILAPFKVDIDSCIYIYLYVLNHKGHSSFICTFITVNVPKK